MKNPYIVGVAGFILMSFSAGWLSLSAFVGIPNMSWIGVLGVLVFALGIALVISVLSKIKKIQIEIEDVESD